MKNILSRIHEIAPKASDDFKKFYQEEVSFAGSAKPALEELSFEFLMGVLYRYFHENGVEWDVSNIQYEDLPESLVEIFEHYEKAISHFS